MSKKQLAFIASAITLSIFVLALLCVPATEAKPTSQPSYCLAMNNTKLLDQNMNPISEAKQGKTYNVYTEITNVCNQPVTTLSIFQVMNDRLVPTQLGTITHTVPASSTVNISVSFVIPKTTASTNYTAQIYQWNHWISQGPSTWQALSAPATLSITPVK